jgi:hypothetical protein
MFSRFKDLHRDGQQEATLFTVLLATANAAKTNGLTCLPKHGGGHPSNDRPTLLNFRDHTPKRTDRGVIDLLSSKQINVFAARQLPKVSDLFRMYAGMSYGSTIRDLCRRLRPQELAINERKLVLFGVLEGLIRRVYKVPTLSNNSYRQLAYSNATNSKYFNCFLSFVFDFNIIALI